MSLYSAMYTSVTGLTTSSQELGVVSDNIANANTIGFKGSRAAFQDILGMSFGSRGQSGLGARLQAIQKILTQGALTSTGMATDLALQGPGFFVVSAPDGTDAFTRAGQFTLDDTGHLVSLEGLRVQGYGADPITGALNGSLQDLQVGSASTPPKSTEGVTIRGVLNSNDVATGLTYDPNDSDTYEFQTQTVIYDSLGNATEASVHYKKLADNSWSYAVVTDGANQQGGTAGTLEVIDSGTLAFDTNGVMTAQTQAGTPGFNPIGATQPQPITFNFEDMTQDGRESATSFISQDGYAAGELANIQIDGEGNIVGAFTNGEQRTLGQVAVATFPGADKLERAGGNLFKATRDAGEANIGQAGTGGRGTLVAGALELSNVDLAGEFVRMIVAQRGFQANGKAITTADTLLGELMQLKR